MMNREVKQRGIYLFYLLLALHFLFLLGGPVGSVFASDLGLSEDDCRCCHGATLADRHHLLVNTDGRECLTCHANSDPFSYDFPVTRDCLVCHTGSLADRHHLLVDQVTYDCFTCHAIVWDPLVMDYAVNFNVNCQSSNPPISTAIVTGGVTDQSGMGLGWVKIATSDGAYSTLATATGTFELPSMAPGSYILVATLDGYVGASQSITVVEGQTNAVNFVLSPLPNPATVSGYIRDENLAPVERARITSADGIYSTLSAADGSYILGNVAEGNLDLTVNRIGYIDVSQTVGVTTGQILRLDFVLPTAVEICTDGLDNNGDGLSDCDDPTCIGTTNCGTPAPEICDDGIDNDDNKLIDCVDPACIGTASCGSPVAEICNDGADNNGDGLFDCNDPLCSTAIYCLSENCVDGTDNNGDSLIDCDDPICTNTSSCLPPPIEICDDGLDNDGNHQIDCADSKCLGLALCSRPVADEICKNGIDDNGNGYVDCADAQCRRRAICLDEICNNAHDDDADGRVDCEDRECRGTPACSSHSKNISLNFSTSASGESRRYKASNTGDKNPSTRWWVDNNRRQWLRLDLGGTYPINKVDIHWHNLYANKYNIRISKNGRFWETAKVVENGDGDLDSNVFKTRDVRFILLDFISSATTGYSIYEVEVFRGSDETADNEDGDDENNDNEDDDGDDGDNDNKNDSDDVDDDGDDEDDNKVSNDRDDKEENNRSYKNSRDSVRNSDDSDDSDED